MSGNPPVDSPADPSAVPPADPPVTPPTDPPHDTSLADAVRDLQEKVERLSSELQNMIALSTAPRDETPIKRPWTSYGGSRR